jgi:gamma-glutamylcyclotransferase (GGCT)/AIG2-like uncharacterized protein YtfP
MIEYVFVYGTLKRGGPAEEYLRASKGHYICDSKIAGIELFLLPAGFPAAKVDRRGGAIARGEIWSVETMTYLDQLEGEGRLYQRFQLPFPTPQGTVTAWIYIYLPDVDEAMPLVSGVYPDFEDAENLVYEWAAYQGEHTPFGANGFDEYIKDDPDCWMVCCWCPYKLNCKHSEK